jgi:hypothetical protein
VGRDRIARLQWREVLDKRTVVVDDLGDGPEEFTIPHYGRVLAELSVPAQEFYDRLKGVVFDADGRIPPEHRLSVWVEQRLPRPVVEDETPDT